MQDDQVSLAERFDEQRPRLRGLAIRMLGSEAAADDAVQTAWIRLSDTDANEVSNLGGWLTTVVSRVAIDMLRAGRVRDHESLDVAQVDRTAGTDPSDEAELADAVGTALLIVLETLSPAERLTFVLHESFDVPYVEIGRILGRSTTATKQLAHRARTKVRQAGQPDQPGERAQQRHVVDAFLEASRRGNLTALIELLDPSIDLVADGHAIAMGADGAVEGAASVAGIFSGRALGAQPALIDGAIGLAWAVDGTVKVAWDVTHADGLVTHINMLADPETLARLDLELL